MKKVNFKSKNGQDITISAVVNREAESFLKEWSRA